MLTPITGLTYYFAPLTSTILTPPYFNFFSGNPRGMKAEKTFYSDTWLTCDMLSSITIFMWGSKEVLGCKFRLYPSKTNSGL